MIYFLWLGLHFVIGTIMTTMTINAGHRKGWSGLKTLCILMIGLISIGNLLEIIEQKIFGGF